jgi:hypothetical protein
MLRWTFRIFVLTLLAACASFWVRSYRDPEVALHEKTDREGLTFTTRQFVLVSARGGVFVGYRRNVLTARDDAEVERRGAAVKSGWVHQPLEKDVQYGGWFFAKLGQPTRLGFGHHSQEISSANGLLTMHSYLFPYAAPIILLSLFPIWWTFRAFLPAPQKKRVLIASPEFADNDYLRSPTEPYAPRS